MPKFTQLNLQGRSPQESQKSSDTQPRYFTAKYKLAAFAGSLVATAALGVFLLQTSGCSKENVRAAIASPAAPEPSTALPAASPVATTETSAQKTTQKAAPKKTRQHKYSASTYNNPEYGVSFRYPKGYNLLHAEDADIDWAGLPPVEMNFAQPGGVALATIELPQKSYPGSDFSSAFFNVAVNPKITAAECDQFALPQSGTAEGSPSQEKTASSKVEAARVKLGAAAYTEVENAGGEPPRKAESRLYHVFQSGACYEFALGLETNQSKKTDTPVNRNEVFRKLNWMLSTVKIETPALPAKTVPEVATGSVTAPAAESKN